MKTYVLTTLYLIAIVAANLLIATFGPAVAVMNAFLFIGLDLSTRDALHEAWRGRGLFAKMGMLIATGSLLSYALNQAAGPIALASFVAFAVSATLDAIVYSLLGDRSYLVRVNGSNVVGAAADSFIFPYLAFGALLPWVILGQFVAKVAGGALWAWVLGYRAVAARREGR